MARRHIMESTFRLNLLNPQHAKINEVIKGLNPKIYKSKNQFLIEACEFYIDHYGEDDIPSKEEKRYEQFVTRDEIEKIKKEIEYSAMSEARKETGATRDSSTYRKKRGHFFTWGSFGGSEEQPAGSDCKPTGRYGRTAGRRCYE